MNRGYLFSGPSARLVALGRALLAVFMLASAFVGQADEQHTAELILAGTLVWSLALYALAYSRRRVYDLLNWSVPIAGVDLALYTALLYATSGANSPYFSPFIVLILAATIQWGSRGATIMGVLTLLAFLPAGWEVTFGIDHDAAAPQTFVVRLGYTGIISVLLSAFGGHLERIVQELARLSDPFAQEFDDSAPPAQACLRHALAVFRARRGLLLLEEEDEPYATLFTLEGGGLTSRRLIPGEDDWIDPMLSSSVFVLDTQSQTTLTRGRRDTWPTGLGPLAPDLGAGLPFERALVIPATARRMTATVFVLDHREPAVEDLSVGAMVGAQISVALEQWDSERARRAASAAEERIRLARDLHDGVLQFLAGAGLQMEALAADRRLPADLRTRVLDLRRSVSDEARDLRGFISTLRPARGLDAPARPLAFELEQLGDRLARHWSIVIDVDVVPEDLLAPADLSYDLSRIVREAVANSVRHGEARRVAIHARAGEGRLHLDVADDGRGFPEAGGEKGGEAGAVAAPRTLSERVRALDGQMRIASTPQGARVMITLPLPGA